MFILFKIKYTNKEFVTIGNLQRLNSNDKIWYLDWIINNMINKTEYYNETPIESIIFSFGFKRGRAPNKEIYNQNLIFQNYHNLNLPITINPLKYGKFIKQVNNIFVIQINDKNTAIITQFKDHNEVEIISGGNIIIKFKDEFVSENKFVRILDNKKFYFENNKEILFIKEMKTKFISKLAKSKTLNNKFITLDIETYIKDNVLEPFLISIFDGKDSKTFCLWDYKNSEELIINALKSIMIRKYNGYKIYVHNLAKFDVIFLLKYLVKLGLVDPIIHNGRIISINLNYGKNNEYNLQFKDSYLILLASLVDLTKGFNVKTLKSVFPYLFTNENNFNYEGKVPHFKFFDNKLTLDQYNNYKSKFNNNWNLKKEAIKYCEVDCISLYQVIDKFADMIFNLFGINIHKYPTLPSLAFAIFRSNFMSENIIPQLSGKIANDIRSGYTGGAVDVYIPKAKRGTKTYCYDANSLYPSNMIDKLMPVGLPSYFKGDITKVDPNAFGFFYCKISAPDNLLHPIIQTHVKTLDGIRTMAPLGQWNDMIFSEEINNAIKLGYKFEILWGYTFKGEIIFKDYVKFFHNLRKEYPKSHPLNYIAKIFLNSLYGRFGMDDQFNIINIIHKDFYPDFENKYFDNIIEKIDLDDYVLVFYNKTDSEEDNSTHNVSISIAAAITAYARIHMSQFKNNPDFKLFYTDTDSIFVNKALADYLVSNTKLGKMKLENVLTKAIFISPKVYCLLTVDGKFNL
uniref:DNA polymerase n=1 Tax=Russula subnigricans TaxID=258989 RepID=A0A649WI53_9AGAM|nr:hypothetical protein [Russula subnigricans]QGK88081.1 hypothetical protein [Russula subnigricans]